MTGHVISFKPTGEVAALHNDAFSLSFLGPQRITRATDIRFSEANQSWSLWLPKPWPHVGGEYYEVPGGAGLSSYETARKVEVEWLNACRLVQRDPGSEDGLKILIEVRDRLGH